MPVTGTNNQLHGDGVTMTKLEDLREIRSRVKQIGPRRILDKTADYEDCKFFGTFYDNWCLIKENFQRLSRYHDNGKR
jgi:hypothetical protein